jgi:hypothetical protein
MAGKINQLNTSLDAGQTLQQIADFCLKYKAVETLCEFNDIVKAAHDQALAAGQGERALILVELAGDC